MPKEKKVFAYTIVQHSAAGYKGDPDFRQGLEERAVDDLRVAEAIMKEGGVLLPNYAAASRYALSEAYPEDYEGMAPKAPGKFSSAYNVDGLKLYLP